MTVKATNAPKETGQRGFPAQRVGSASPSALGIPALLGPGEKPDLLRMMDLVGG